MVDGTQRESDFCGGGIIIVKQVVMMVVDDCFRQEFPVLYSFIDRLNCKTLHIDWRYLLNLIRCIVERIIHIVLL